MKDLKDLPHHGPFTCFLAAFSMVIAVHTLNAQTNVTDPTGKFIVADSEGVNSINTGEKIETIVAKAVYLAEGSTIETQLGGLVAIVLSNGTGLSFSPDTSLQFTQYQQARFTPNRTDLDTEPSNSKTEAMLDRGGVGISSSNLLPGSTFIIRTRHAAIFIQKGKLFIESSDNQTTVSLLEGNLTIRDELNGTSVPLSQGQQAIITRRSSITPAIIRIQLLPENDVKNTTEMVNLSTMARRTVYFDIVPPTEGGEAQLIPVTILPGNNNGPNTVSPFQIKLPVSQ